MNSLSRLREMKAAAASKTVGTIHLGQVVSVSPLLISECSYLEVGTGDPFPAISLVELTDDALGATVAYSKASGNVRETIVLGLVVNNVQRLEVLEAALNNDRCFSERKEITLRCGKASITLTKAGKIILRGTYISSRSSGMNRIKGGSVQLN